MDLRDSNIGDGDPKRSEPLHAGMAAYDKLPAVLRRRLAYATVPFGAIQVTEYLRDCRRNGLPLRAAAEAICVAITETEDSVAIGPLPMRRGEP